MAVYDTIKILTGLPEEKKSYIKNTENLHTNNEMESLFSLGQSKNGQKAGFVGNL